MKGKEIHIKLNPHRSTITGYLFIIIKQKNKQLATWLMFVPVCEGQRQREAIVKMPIVLSFFLLVHEGNPVIHATVGPTLTQQTVDKCLLEPATTRKRKRRGEEGRSAFATNIFQHAESFAQPELPLHSCMPPPASEAVFTSISVKTHIIFVGTTG